MNALLRFLLILGGTFIEGAVLQQLWKWFIMPIFPLPELAYGIALGLSLTVGMLTHQMRSPSVRDEHEKWVEAIAYFIAPFFYLTLGAIFHSIG